MADLDLQRDSTAVVIMDYQNDIVSNYSTDGEGLLQRAASVLESARQAGIPVIYVVVQFREGYPEVLPRNRQRFGTRLIEGTPGADVHPAVAPQPGEAVVVKPAHRPLLHDRSGCSPALHRRNHPRTLRSRHQRVRSHSRAMGRRRGLSPRGRGGLLRRPGPGGASRTHGKDIPPPGGCGDGGGGIDSFQRGKVRMNMDGKMIGVAPDRRRAAERPLTRVQQLDYLGIPAAWSTTGGSGGDAITFFAAALMKSRDVLLGTSINPNISPSPSGCGPAGAGPGQPGSRAVQAGCGAKSPGHNRGDLRNRLQSPAGPSSGVPADTQDPVQRGPGGL